MRVPISLNVNREIPFKKCQFARRQISLLFYFWFLVRGWTFYQIFIFHWWITIISLCIKQWPFINLKSIQEYLVISYQSYFLPTTDLPLANVMLLAQLLILFPLSSQIGNWASINLENNNLKTVNLQCWFMTRLTRWS